MNKEELLEERERLINEKEWLNGHAVYTPESEDSFRILTCLRRIKEIDEQLSETQPPNRTPKFAS